MNIAVITLAVQQKSGARAPIQLALALRKKGHVVTIYGYSELSDSHTVHYLREQGIEVHLLESYTILNHLRSGMQLRKLLVKNNHDFLTLHTIPEWIIAAKTTGIQCVGCYYGTQFGVLKENLVPTPVSLVFEPLVNAIIYLRSLIIVRIPDKVVAISQFTAHEARRLYGRKIKVIYLGSDHLRKDDTSNTGTKNSSGSAMKLLSVSRLTPYKNFELIINTVNRLTANGFDIELDIAGPPSVYKYVQKLSNLATSKIRIHANPTDKELVLLYKQCDVYITADKYLFFGLPVLEAAQFGKPTVALSYAAAREVIHHQVTGYIARDAFEIETYLTKLYNDTRLLKHLGTNAHKFSKSLNWDRCAVSWEDILLEAVKKV